MQFRRVFAAIAAAASFAAPSAWADIVWNWSYTGTNIQAGGTLTTADAADADGYHLITGITGNRNGDLITGLYPTGSASPGNEPFALDNLIRLGPQNQLTGHGFGFATASGGYSNPFFADFLSPATYMEVFTTASSYSEPPITFTASVVPEPASILLVLAGLGIAGFASGSRRRAA